MKVCRFKDLEAKNLGEKHSKNNKEIFEKITKFMEHNNLSPEDFFIGGSSCCSYMNYFIIHEVRDVDIFLRKDIKVEKTEGIDVIVYKAIEGYTPELIQKDGLYFLSPYHAATKTAVKALLYQKKQSILYFKLLLDYMGITVEEFQEQFEKEVEQHVFPFTDKNALEIVKSNMHKLQRWGKAPDVLPAFLQENIKKGIMQGKISG